MTDKKASLLGVVFDAITLKQAVERCVAFCREPLTSHVVLTINASHLCMMRRDAGLAQACSTAELIVADGMPVVWAIRASGQSMPERVPGIDLMTALLEASAPNGLRVYFLGARNEVVTKLVELCKVRFPGLQVAGFRDGYFSSADHGAIADDIRESGADILFIGLPSPFKEVWSERYRDRLQVPVILGVGGSFDVLAGYIRRAPRMFQSFGLEWLWRLMMEPRKLWKRYLSTNSEFIWRALSYVIARRLYVYRWEVRGTEPDDASSSNNRRTGLERRAFERRKIAARRSNSHPLTLTVDRRCGALTRRIAERRSPVDRRHIEQRLVG